MNKNCKKNHVDALLILDGWGVNPATTDNAVAMAQMPFLDMLEKNYPCARLLCSGNAVGLPDGVMGNSEVGHMNIGAGRKVFQDLVRINNAIEDRSFFAIPSLVEVMNTVSNRGSSLHLMGLLSDGGVHSHMGHLFALIDMACDSQINNIFIHPILDGRDTPPQSGIQYITRLQKYLDQKGKGTIATLCGRFYAMDRDTRWERVEKAYDLYTQGICEDYNQTNRQIDKEHNKDQQRIIDESLPTIEPLKAINDAYASGQTDEFVKPVLLAGKEATIKDEDAIIFFNFRADRAREIARSFTEKEFTCFQRKVIPRLSDFLCMTQYEESLPLPVIFKPQHLNNTLGEIVSLNGFEQLRIAETEKYAHVTYFFNGGDEKVFPLEERILIPSPRDVRTYDEKPEMSAQAVAETACEKIRKGKFRLIVLNFANMDMVGHTGNLDAAIKACSTVDSCVKQVVEAVWEAGGTAMVTADHGNAEQMKDEDGNPHTAHTLNPVKFILAGEKYRNSVLGNGILGDIAPTILKVMGIDQPKDMSGTPLF
ncbi:MAG: 2,3-bisphosphoglycerate-independent phosphoglycerate mutase [Desulfamplus sp.]|nr:2,3-bisphosphoglycerate-independent phosphoglycerate mutase [Desulfamplus sp.]